MDVDVVVINQFEPATSIDNLRFKLHDSDTSRLVPIPGVNANLDANPDFNQSALTGAFSCTPPGPQPDTGADGAGRAVSSLSCQDAALDGPSLDAFGMIRVARVHYAIPPSAQAGNVTLSLSDLAVFDASLRQIASCAPGSPVTCFPATLQLTQPAAGSVSVGGVTNLEPARVAQAERASVNTDERARNILGIAIAAGIAAVLGSGVWYVRRRRRPRS